MKRKQCGFTMVDLVVVIVVAVVAFAILVPGRHGTRLPRQAVCRTNLSGIGKAIATYQTTYYSFPMIRNGKGMDPTAEPRKAMSKAEFEKLIAKENTETNIHIIDNLLLLKYTDCLDNWKIFRCPSNPDASKQMERDENSTYGFSDGKDFYIDYSYHNGYRYQGDKKNPAAFGDDMESMPIMADNPGLSLKEFDRNINAESDDDANYGEGYSHDDDVINALYPDASVQGLQKVFGGVKDNNIYTSDLTREGKSNGSTAWPTSGTIIQHKSDSVLIPADIRKR